MKKLAIASTLILPLLASCNLFEVVGEFGDGTAFGEMGTTYKRASEYTYENYTRPMLESSTSGSDAERQNMMQDAARRNRR